MRINTKNYILKKMSLKLVNKNYLNWFKDKKIADYIDNSPRHLEDLRFYINKVNKNSNTYFWAIFKNKKHVGNIKIFEINYKKKIGRLGILIGEKKFRNIGLGQEVIEAIKNFLLKKNILYLWLGVQSKNLQAIRSYEKCGFFKYKTKKKIMYMRCNIFTSKVILGGAQLNSNYGITNFKNKTISKKETKRIVNFSKQKNIWHIDGAESYKLFKDNNIGLLKNFKIDTKISLKNISNYKNLKTILIRKYLKNNVKVDTLFIHDGDNIFKNSMDKKINILLKLKKNRLISKIGISLYDFSLLKKIISKLSVDVIQVPYNVVDNRLEKFRKLLQRKKVKVYARSIFLQGSLLKKVSEIKELGDIYEKVKKSSKKINKSNFDACINFVLTNDLVDKIIIGVRNLKEMKQLVNFKSRLKMKSIKFKKQEKLFAYKPSEWK